MDVETVQAIEALRDDLQRTLATKDDVGGLRAELYSVRPELYSVRDELRRHTDIRFESLRDDIRIVAEGVAALAAKVDRLAGRN